MSEADNGDGFPDDRREDVVRTPTRTMVTACALSAALLVAGCVGDSDTNTPSGGDLFLQPAADRGPDPFTASTTTAEAAASPLTRTPQPAQSRRTGPQSLSGETPGLYGGTRGAGSCDVRRQIDALAADRTRARVFARAAGVSRTSIPGYLRSLTSVVLRADTRVTNHGFRDGMGTGYQSVLQAGTAVLVDAHGVPRVRCACGNPLAPPVGTRGESGVSGRGWSGYEPGRVVVVAPATQVIADITIIDVVDNTWIERPVGHRGHDHDHVVPPAKPMPPDRDKPPHDRPGHDSGRPTPTPSRESATPSGEPTSPPERTPADCVTPDVTVTPGATDDIQAGAPSDPGRRPTDCPTATVTPTAPPSSADPGTRASPEEPGAPASRTEPESSPGSSEDVGPEAVPDGPDTPDGGGLIPDDSGATGSIFGSPTDVFDG
ncbi:DUF6777 domain-containing protein [Streptomyces sp. KS_5]|uniref:DUF6777 domain-containing protein n=1 Tax=Streptomyces TaxID=1883 RepID=UPI00210F0C8E|nr:DUF6777 domain-containing protein [Streptomyces sp. KS_5]